MEIDIDRLIVTQTQVQHNEDDVTRHHFENLEMKRLGLPTQFTSAKSKKNLRKHRKKRNSSINRLLNNWNKFKIASMNDMKTNYESVNNLIESDVLMASDTYKISNDQNEYLENLPEDNVVQTFENDDTVEEVKSIIMSNNSYDYEDLPADNNISSNEMSIDDDNDTTKKKNKSHKKKKKSNMNIYWRQRFILFSRFEEGIRLDEESWYSVTPEAIAKHIAQRLSQTLSKRYPDRCSSGFIIMDPFCGAGGNVIQFALQSLITKVYAIDIDPEKIEMAKHNSRIYECDHKIEFICGDFFQLTQQNRFRDLIDVCFYSPPWGGPDYINMPKFSLNNMIPNGFDICRHTSKYLTQNIIMLLPRNFDETELQKVSDLVYNIDTKKPIKELRMVELERNMVFNKVKTITAYFGNLIDGFNENPTKVLFETE